MPALALGQEYHWSRMVTANVTQHYRSTGTADALGRVGEPHGGNNVTYLGFVVKP